MRVNTPFMTVVGGVAGSVVAVAAFQSGNPVTGTASAYRTRPTVSSAAASAPRITTLWLPCAQGTHLHRGACVSVRHRLVTVVDPAPAVAVPAEIPTAKTQKPAKHHAKAHHTDGGDDGTQAGDDGSGDDDGTQTGDDGSGDDGPEPGDD